MTMRSFLNGTLEHSEFSELLGKMRSEHLRNDFEYIFECVLLEGSLVVAGWIEVQGHTQIGGALAGDYNHGQAHFHGDVTAAVFIPSDYEIVFASKQVFENTVDDRRIVDKIRKGKAWTVPKPKKEKPFESYFKGKVDSDFVPYDPGSRYEKGAVVEHSDHGRGIVTKVLNTMYVEILFASGKKMLAHQGW